MKKTKLVLVMLFLGFVSLAQNVNLVIFSEDGYAFTAYVNGIKQNQAPESNVKVVGVSPNIALRLEFEDKSKPQLKQNMALEPGFEHSVRIKEDSKKQLKLRYFGQTPLADPGNSGVSTINQSSEPKQKTYNQANDNGMGATSQTTVTTTTTQVNSSTTADPNNVVVNMSVGGVGMNVNMSGLENMGGNSLNSTTSTTVTSTTSSSSSSETRGKNLETSGTAAAASTGCSRPMNSADFTKMKQSVESKPFSDTKMSTAKVATKNACLSVNQVKEICKLFSMDEDKLAYAKYAYEFCTEKNNYYQVGDVFSFSATTEELNSFLGQ